MSIRKEKAPLRTKLETIKMRGKLVEKYSKFPPRMSTTEPQRERGCSVDINNTEKQNYSFDTTSKMESLYLNTAGTRSYTECFIGENPDLLLCMKLINIRETICKLIALHRDTQHTDSF